MRGVGVVSKSLEWRGRWRELQAMVYDLTCPSTSPSPPPPHAATERSKSALKKATEPVSESECKCLVRATDGKRKFSTTLTQRELASFHDSYMTILKVCCRQRGIVGLCHGRSCLLRHAVGSWQ